jgi:Undecaprenyl-phosphate glucose phosphotransferase
MSQNAQDHGPSPRRPTAATATAFAVPVSRSVPRLADFRLADKSSLIAPTIVSGSLRALEFIVIAMTGLAIAASYVPGRDAFGTQAYLFAIAGTSLATVFLTEALGLYALTAIRSPLKFLPRMALAWGGGLAALATSVFLLKVGPDFSRVWLVLWFGCAAIWLLTVRVILASVTRTLALQGRLNRRAAIFGTGPVCDGLLTALEADPSSDIRICGVFTDDGVARPRMINGYPVLGAIVDLVALARKTRIDMVILALPLNEEAQITNAMRGLMVLPVDIRLAGTATGLKFRPRAYSYIGNVPLMDLADKPIADWGMVAKSAFDKLVGLTALILLAPVLAAVAIAVRLDSRGPILFRQKRYGFNNELIEVFKFRSMYVDQCDVDASRLVSKGDARVTDVGRFIRKTSLDELPQLLNVLRGDLSLVGPRPHAVQAKAGDRLYDAVVETYFTRHRVKPGITGWAQINGWRGETDTEEKIQKRVEHDIYYIENWSLFLDVYILAMTPYALVKSDNAY